MPRLSSVVPTEVMPSTVYQRMTRGDWRGRASGASGEGRAAIMRGSGGNGVPGVVSTIRSGKIALDSHQIGGPGVVRVEFGAIAEAGVHHDDGIGGELGDLVVLRAAAIGAEDTGDVDPEFRQGRVV